MLRQGTMPDLDSVLEAVADVREKYSAEIKASRSCRGKRESAQQLFQPSMRALGFTDEIDASVNAEPSEYQQAARKWWQKRKIR